MLWRERQRHRPGRRRIVRTAVLPLLVAAAVVVPGSPRATANRTPVSVEGFMPFGFSETVARRLAVDSALHVGFVATSSDGPQLHVYDLRRLKKIATLTTEQLGESFAVDEIHHRVFYRPTQAQFDCSSTVLHVLNSRTRRLTPRLVPCYGSLPFFTRGLSYYAPSNKLYVIGATSAESVGTQATGTNNYHETTVIRQLDADTFKLEWEADAGDVCDTNSNTATNPDPVVGRTDGGVISYCYVGGQGRAVWIPMRGEAPLLQDGEPVVRVSPTIGRLTTPVIDHISGRLLILEDNPPFGPAVYVYDPRNERFVGVVPSGVALEHGGVFYDYFRGFSERSGRLYILNRTGLVMADVRTDPLPSGVSFPVLTGGVNNIYTGSIAVDAGLRRLFIPYPKRGGFVVLRDDVPRAAPLQPVDPDAGTADVPEVPGVTGRTSSGGAIAFGAHVVGTGGFSRIVNNADQLCTSESDTVHDRDEFGRCPADRAVTPGNREYFVAQSMLEAGSDSGTAASAFLERSPAGDSATDSDVRSIGRCLNDRLPQQARQTVEGACPNGKGDILEPFTGGSQGPDGKGYPVRGALCVDFERKKAEDATNAQPFGAAQARCDAASSAASAGAHVAALLIEDKSAPVFVAQATSSVRTLLTGEGVVTVASATARGILIGSGVQRFAIGSITTTATTRARGRSGSSRAEYKVRFANVEGPGIGCVQCDPAAVATAINKVFGAQLRARAAAPYRLASPRGYQGIVTKDPGLRASDRAVNDDDTLTANGLDLIFYNDSSPANRAGSAGRSRLVVSLAGVEAESRYGIFLIPDATDGSESKGDSGGGIAQPGGDAGPPAGGEATGGSTVTPRPGRGVARKGSSFVTRSFAFVRTQPGEFAMLFVLWSLLAMPVYLGGRRRALSKALER